MGGVILPYIILLISFFIMIKGAELLIDAATDLANRLRIPQLIIGLTVVAFGTCAPEAVVNTVASLSNKNDLAIGNVVGSNLVNIGVVLGITALLFTVKADWPAIRIDIPFAFISSLVLLFLAGDGLDRNDGLVFTILFLIYLNYLWMTSKANRSTVCTIVQNNKRLSVILFYLCIGIGSVVAGGRWVVSSSVDIARLLGLSEALIGLTVVSLGTSLPELVTSITACYKKNDSIAIGNIIGSNIFNILFVLSVSTVISPIDFNTMFIIDIYFMIFMTFILFIFSYTHKKITRLEGLGMLGLYAIYFVFILFRN